MSLIDRQYLGLACGECGNRISSSEFAAYWMAKNADGFKFCTDACAKLANDANPSGRSYAPRSVRCSANPLCMAASPEPPQVIPHPGAGGGDDNDVKAAWDDAIARSLKACQIIEQECAAHTNPRETNPAYWERIGAQRCIDAIKDIAEQFKEPDVLKAEIEAELTDLRRVYRAAEALVKRLGRTAYEALTPKR